MMEYNIFDILGIEEITDDNILEYLLKKESIIQKHAKSKTPGKLQILKDKEKLKNIITSNHYKKVSSTDDLKKLDDGESMCIQGVFDHVRFKMSSTVNIIDFDGTERSVGTYFLDKYVFFEKGFVKYKCILDFLIDQVFRF